MLEGAVLALRKTIDLTSLLDGGVSKGDGSHLFLGRLNDSSWTLHYMHWQEGAPDELEAVASELLPASVIPALD